MHVLSKDTVSTP